MATSHVVSREIWLMFAAGLGLLLWVLAPWAVSSEVWVHEGLVEVTSRIFGILRQRQIVEIDPAEDSLRDIVPRVARPRAGLMDALDYYCLELKETGHKPVTVGRHIRERGQAERIAREMKQAMGLK
jgi:hypothetical protein